MDNNTKYSLQIAYLNQLLKRKLISHQEYEKIKEFIKEKYKIKTV